jgi:diguanylate cyclase (GGDEF)-like protein
MYQWVRALRQTTTYLGLVMIAVIWGGVFWLANEAHERAAQDGLRQGSNLVRVFEEYIARVIKGTDGQLQVLRTFYERDPQHFEFDGWNNRTKTQSDLTIHFSIVGPDGMIKLSTLGPIASRIDISQHEPFSVHANSNGDDLYISKPTIGLISGKRSIQLTRRLSNPDGSFAGIIGASLDILQLEKFYNSIDVGPRGVISLVGFDGIIRARSGRDPMVREFIGESIEPSRMSHLFEQLPAGSHWGVSKSTHRFEGINRLISYRVVEGLPLFAVVGLAESDVFQQALLTAQKYYQIGFLLTVIVLIAMAIGVTRQMKLVAATAALERTNRRFDAALENMPHGLCMYDRELRLAICNRRYGEMYGLTLEQTKPGTPLRAILEARVAAGCSPQDSAKYVADRLRDSASSTAGYFVNELRDGRIYAISRQSMPDGGSVGIHQDITPQKRAEGQIAYLARHDALTGVANRMVLLETMREALERLRHGGQAFAVMVLDLDVFKAVNDSLGHPVGDALLKAVANRLKQCVHESDTVARLGGDEFALLAMAEGDPRQAAMATAGRVLVAMAAPYAIDGNDLDIGTSIGVALAPQHGMEVDELLKSADLALYKAKAEGGNTYRLFETAMLTEACMRRVLQSDLRNALLEPDGQLEVHYQAIVDIAQNNIAGVEALVRWRHPLRGMIAPTDFIPLAEETGLIHPLGEWVLRTACAEAVNWPAHIKVGVNLSAVQFRRGESVEIVTSALAQSGLPPERLELEITESVLMQGTAENVGMLHRLQALGISIVLDDFGTGYSSLSYLRLFPFDRIKIDRSFVSELSSNADCAAIVSAVAGLGKSLAIDTVAEGVETAEQLALVHAAGCTYAQGFLFGRPCRASELSFSPSGEQKRKSEAA